MSDQKTALFANIAAVQKVIGAAQEASTKEKELPPKGTKEQTAPPTPSEKPAPSG